MQVNKINFGMKFTPRADALICAAKKDCIYPNQLNEYKKCVNFLKETFPEKTLDIKTELGKPKGIIGKILSFFKNTYYDKAYIDDKFVTEAEIVNDTFAIRIPHLGISPIGEDNLRRLIVLSNSILGICVKKQNFYSVSYDKFLG